MDTYTTKIIFNEEDFKLIKVGLGVIVDIYEDIPDWKEDVERAKKLLERLDKI